MLNKYKVIKNVLNKDQIESILKKIKDNGCLEPHDFENFEGIKIDYNLIDVDRAVENVINEAEKYFLENFSIPNRQMILTRSYGTIMHPGAMLVPHKDLYNSGRLHDFSYGDALVCNVYLSDNFEGGELVFPELGIEIKPEAGDVVLFPGYLIEHGVNEVKSGSRITLINHFSLMSEEDTLKIQNPENSLFYKK